MEVVAEVKTLSVYMKCDKCNNGLMLENGHIILTTDSPKYPHKCNNCGYEMKVSRKMFEKHGKQLPTCVCGTKMALDLEDEEEETKIE